jgi:hypothetical protein
MSEQGAGMAKFDGVAMAAQAGAFFRNFMSVVAALGVVGTALWWGVSPRVEAELRRWVAVQIGVDADVIAGILDTQANLSDTLVGLTATVRDLSDEVSEMRQKSRERLTAPIIFEQRGHRVSDGRIGGLVVQTYHFRKVADCGRPRSRAYFTNGGGVTHLFEDKSNNDDRGLSAAALVQDGVQSVTFSARIPAGDGVRVGTGYAFVILDWPEVCPDVPPLRSPEVSFRILPAE